MGFIYKVTNKANGKIYIGQTSRSVDVRWKEHIRDSSDKPSCVYCSLLHYAIRKYGANAFVVECIEECSDTEMDERERYWIEHFKTCDGGYNIARGGQGKPLCSNKEILDAWNSGLSAKQISEKLGISNQIVCKRLRLQGITKFEIMSRGNKACAKGRSVIRISLDGSEYKVYRSLTEAATENNQTVARISMVCSGKRITSGNYRWKYYDGGELQQKFEPLPLEDYPKIQVHQYTLDGQYVRSFVSAIAAAKSLNKHCTSSILNVCRKQCGIGYGYQWRFEKYDNIPAIKVS